MFFYLRPVLNYVLLALEKNLDADLHEEKKMYPDPDPTFEKDTDPNPTIFSTTRIWIQFRI